MGHTVLPVLVQLLLQNLFLLGGDRVREVAGIAQVDLLIPAFLSSHLLPLEGVETVHVDVDVREEHGDGRVTHVLVQVHRRRECHA